MHTDQWRQRLKLDGRLRSALDDLLIPNEAVDVVAYGEAGSAVIGTATHLLVFKRGRKAGVPFGHRLKVFEHESVVAVKLRPVKGGGVLVIHAPLKVASCAVYWVDERDDVVRARNAIVLEEPLDDYGPAVERMRELVADHQSRHGRATPYAARPQVAEAVAAPAPRVERLLRAEPAVTCTSCGAGVEKGWRYCPACGTSFEQPIQRWPRLRTKHSSPS